MKVLLLDNSGMITCNNDCCIETKTGNFAKDLLELQNDVTLFGQILPATINTTSIFKVKENGLKIKGLKRKSNKVLNYATLYLKVLPAIIKSDFVYIFYPNSFKFAALFAKLFRRKYGLYIRGMKELDDIASKEIIKSASVVFTVSDFFTDYVNDLRKNKKAITVRPMISFTEKDIILERRYLQKRTYNILFIGRMTNDKGLVELLSAIANIKKEKRNFNLKLVGTGEDLERLQELSEELSILDYVSFEGAEYNAEKIREYYKEADIFILPSYHEGFPRTLYEAMIFGVPIITTFVGGIPHLMKDGLNCTRIEPRSIKNISDALIDALENYGEMGALAQNATKIISKIVRSNRLTHAQHLHAILNED